MGIPCGKAEMKTWSQVILVNLALTAVGLRVWLDPWPALGEVPLLDLVSRHRSPHVRHLRSRLHRHARPRCFLLPGCLPFRSGRYGWLAGSRARRLPRPGAFRPGLPRQTTIPLLLSWARSTIPLSRARFPGRSGLSFPSAAFTPVFPSSGLSGAARPAPACTPSPSNSCPGPPTIPAGGWPLWCWRSRATSATPSRRSSRTLAGETTTWKSAWAVPGNGTPWTIPTSTATRWPIRFSTLLNQLFGKSKEPFWQQAYTNLVRWTIELHRIMPGGWVTLRDIYRCAIDPDLLSEKIEQARAYAESACPSEVRIPMLDFTPNVGELTALCRWQTGRRSRERRMDPRASGQAHRA